MTGVKPNYATSQQVNESITDLVSPPYRANEDSVWRWPETVLDKTIVCAFLQLANLVGCFIPVKNLEKKKTLNYSQASLFADPLFCLEFAQITISTEKC